MKYLGIAAVVGASLVASAASAQTDAHTTDYINNGFALMDANKDGSVDRAEFGQFMQARLARQSRQLDAAFAGLDANKDGSISAAEARALPALASNFAAVDTDGDKRISKAELQTAAAAAQAQEAGFAAQ